MNHINLSSISDDDATSLRGGAVSVGIGAFADAIGKFTKTKTLARTIVRSNPIVDVGAGVGVALGLSLFKDLL